MTLSDNSPFMTTERLRLSGQRGGQQPHEMTPAAEQVSTPQEDFYEEVSSESP